MELIFIIAVLAAGIYTPLSRAAAPVIPGAQTGVCDVLQDGTSLCQCDTSRTKVQCKDKKLTAVPVAEKFPASTKTLELETNPIKDIPAGAFSSLTSLKYLNLNNLHLEKIEDNAFLGLTRLTEIALLGNENSKLSAITSRTFAHLWSLERLNLRGNPIKTVAGDAFYENINLTTVHLGTRLECDCSLLPFKRWVDSKKSRINISGLCDAKSQGSTANKRLTEVSVKEFGDCEDKPKPNQACYACEQSKTENCTAVTNCKASDDACGTMYSRKLDKAGNLVEEFEKTCIPSSACTTLGRDLVDSCYITNANVVSTCVSCCKGYLCNFRSFQGFSDRRTAVQMHCESEITKNALKGSFTWRQSAEGTTVKVVCPIQLPPSSNEQQSFQLQALTANRICKSGGFWGEPDLAACPSKITKLATSSITSSNADAAASELANLTRYANLIDADDVTSVADMMEQILPYSTENNSEYIVEIFSNMMDTNDSVLSEAKGSTERLLHQIEQFAADVQFTKNPLVVQKVNMAVKIEKVSAANFSGRTYRPSDNNSIVLPRSLFEKVNGSHVKRIQFVNQAKDSLFKAVWNRTTAQANDSVNSLVLSASVGRLSLQNLTDNVSITFEHYEKNASKPRCVFWDISKAQWSSDGCSVRETIGQSTTCECNHLTNFALLIDIYGDLPGIDEGNKRVLSIVSYIGCGISCFGLVLTVITYLMFRKLRKDNPSKILINLCFALLGVNIIFITSTIDTSNLIGCKISAALLHYFLLASFTWMAIEAFYMYLALVLVFQTYYSRLMLKLCLFGWGIPLLAVIITVSINVDNYGSYNNDPGSNHDLCWLKNLAFYGAFLAPVGFILIINSIAFGLVIRQLMKLSKGRAPGQADPGVAARLRGGISVMVLLGLTWVFALFAVGDAAVVFSYLFAIFNSLQGFALFVFYCLFKTDVQHTWMRACPCCPDPALSRSSSKGTTSTEQSLQKNKRKDTAVEVQLSSPLAKTAHKANNNSIDTNDISLRV